MGRPVAVAADPEVNHFILQEEGKSVEMFYLDSIVKLLGKMGHPPMQPVTFTSISGHWL